MLALCVSLVAAAHLSSPGFERVNVDPEVGERARAHFVRELGARGVTLVVGEDPAAQGVLTARVEKTEAGYVTEVELFSVPEHTSVGDWTGAPADEAALLAWLSATAERIGRHMGALPPKRVELNAPAIAARNVAWIPATLGGGALIAGFVLFVVGKSDENIMDPAAHSAAVTRQHAGLVLGAIGLAFIAVGGAMFLFGTPKSAMQLTLVPLGPGLALSGMF